MIATLATDTAAIASIDSWQHSLMSASDKLVLPSNYLDALPTEARSVFGSIATAVNSIRTANGFPDGMVAATSTSKAAAAPRQTNAALGAAAGVAAGFVGVLMAL